MPVDWALDGLFKNRKSMFRSAIIIVTLVVTHALGLDWQRIEQFSYIYIFMLFTQPPRGHVLVFTSVSVALSNATLVTTGRLNPI